MPTNAAPNIETLLGQLSWLRNLARRLAGSSDFADDAVQDTMFVALRNPPDEQRPVRPWLAGVLRHLLQKRTRDQGRRRLGDGKAVSDPTGGHIPDAEATPETLAHQAQALRVLAELVCGLDEPQQKIIWLRFFEDQTSEQIAAALGVPAGTIRRQQRETLERLRHRMDRKHGGRQAWTGLFLLPKKAAPIPRITLPTKLALPLALTALTAVVIVTGSKKQHPKPTSHARPATLAILAEPPPRATAQVNGVVIDSANDPIPKAVVLLRCIRDCPIGAASDRVTTTDKAGLFTFEGLAEAAFTVIAAEPNHISASVKVELNSKRSPSPLQLVLQQGGFAVDGTVLDEGGGIIGGAVIVADLHDRQNLAVSAADGHYLIRLPKGTHQVSVQADGYAPVQGQAIDAAGDVTRDFIMTAAATVEGKVVDVEGKPIVNALVMATRHGGAAGAAYTTTTNDGHFRFGDLGVGRVQFSARKGAYFGASGSVLDLAASDRLTNVVIALKQRPPVTGMVQNARSQPLSECTVRVEPGPLTGSMDWRDVATRCKADGSFILEALPAGRFAIHVRSQGHAWSERDFIIDDTPVQLTFTLNPEVVIKGIVLAADGSPVKGARVELATRASQSSDAQFTGSASRTTDAQGRFEANRLGAGFLHASARHDSFGFVETMQPVPEASAREVVLRFLPGAFILGKVVWDDGKPAAKVIARWHCGRESFRDATDEAGNFRIGPVPQGVGELAARSSADGSDSVGGPPNAGRKRLYVKAGTELSGNTLVLKRTDQMIAGKVVDAFQRPVANARVVVGNGHEAAHLAENQLPSWGQTQEGTSGIDGTFTVSGLARGTYQVAAFSAQHPLATLNNVSSSSRDLLIQFSSSSHIRGLATDPQGVPFTKFEVSVSRSPAPFDPKRGVQWMAETSFPIFGGAPKAHHWTESHDGTFVVDKLVEGTPYDIKVQTPDERYGAVARVTTLRTRPPFITVVAYQGQRIRGRIVDTTTGKPIAEAGVALGNRSDLFATTTNEDGVFQLGGVFPGSKEYLHLRVFPRHVPEMIAVDVPSDGRDLDIGSITVLRTPPEPETRTPGDVATMGSVSTGAVLVPGSRPPQVAFVVEGSPAAAARIEPGSIVTAIDGHAMLNGAETAALFLLNTPAPKPAMVTLREANGSERIVELQRVKTDTPSFPFGP